jgi:hypothetical protein
MSAVEALKQARAVGVRLSVDGGELALEAAAPPPPEVLQLLTRYKSAIMILLRQGEISWSGDDWRGFFEERAAISEFDHGLSRADAEKNAFNHCIHEWLRQNPISSAPGICHQCLQQKGLIQAYFTGGDVHIPLHVWLHSNCANEWHDTRRDSAIASLEALGLRATNAVS